MVRRPEISQRVADDVVNGLECATNRKSQGPKTSFRRALSPSLVSISRRFVVGEPTAYGVSMWSPVTPCSASTGAPLATTIFTSLNVTSFA
jgi:hypothetical protein